MKVTKNKMIMYQLNISHEVLKPVTSFWNQKKKRPIRMKRWRKLSMYMGRAIKGKSYGKSDNQ